MTIIGSLPGPESFHREVELIVPKERIVIESLDLHGAVGARLVVSGAYLAESRVKESRECRKRLNCSWFSKMPKIRTIHISNRKNALWIMTSAACHSSPSSYACQRHAHAQYTWATKAKPWASSYYRYAAQSLKVYTETCRGKDVWTWKNGRDVDDCVEAVREMRTWVYCTEPLNFDNSYICVAWPRAPSPKLWYSTQPISSSLQRSCEPLPLTIVDKYGIVLLFMLLSTGVGRGLHAIKACWWRKVLGHACKHRIPESVPLSVLW